MHYPDRQTKLALLVAALLLLSNALVTAHAFGEVDHAVQDGCQLLHQFERQQHAPAGVPAALLDCARHERPADAHAVVRCAGGVRHYRSRAPPFA